MSEHLNHEMHENSLDAYEEEKPKLGKRCAAVYGVYERLGAATDRQVMEALGFTDMNSVRPRINDMMKMGLLIEVGSRKDSATGHRVRIVGLKTKQQGELFS